MTEEENKEAQASPSDSVAAQPSATVSSEARAENVREALKVYWDLRMPKILLLGLMSGFPWILIGSMMTYWLRSEDLSRTGIGLFGIVFTVYAFNMMWAPIVDRFKLPLLSKLGQRRSWIVLMQTCIAILALVMSMFEPKSQLLIIAICTFLIALSSATMDVAIDATRIELIARSEARRIGAGSAMATAGWWTGYQLFGAVAFFIADFVGENMGINDVWPIVFRCMALVPIVAMVLMLLFVDEPERQTSAPGDKALSQPFVRRIISIWSMQLPARNFAIGAGIMFVGLLFLFTFYERFLIEIGLEESYILLCLQGSSALLLTVSLLISRFLNTPDGASRIMLACGLFIISLALLVVALEFNPEVWVFVVCVAIAIVVMLLIAHAETWIKPVASFLSNYGLRIGLTLLLLVFLFKIGEAFLGRMSIVFYKDIGFSRGDIGLGKFASWAVTVTFAVIGSIINARYGLYFGLLLGGIAMAATNLLFAVLAYYPEFWLFIVAVMTDQVTAAISTVALVAFLSQLCDRAYAATQYAALSSIGNLSRTMLVVFSGLMVDTLDSSLGSTFGSSALAPSIGVGSMAPGGWGGVGGGEWPVFFIITALMVLPSLALLLYIRKDIESLMAGQTTKVI